MDWDNLIADTEDILTVHYSEGRQGHAIDKVIVHYNDGNLSVEDCYRVWQSREASAHYQVEESGRIGQLVWDANTSWNCGKWVPNCESIGIEHANRSDGTISDACLDAGAHLVAAVCVKYGLGRPEWLTNVFPHCYFVSTSCPGEIYGSQKDAYIACAQAWYDRMTGAATDVPDERSAAVQLYDGNATDAQRWVVTHNDDGSVTLAATSCGLALDVSGAGTAGGTPVQVHTPNGSVAQRWSVHKVDGDYSPESARPIELEPACAPGLRLDCIGAGLVDGTGIQIYGSNGSNAQRWTILDHGDGTWTLVNVGSSKALDVVGGGN